MQSLPDILSRMQAENNELRRKVQRLETLDSTGSAGIYINVMDYGATGNGTTDDYAAFAAAATAAGNTDYLFVPPGTYYLSQSLTFNGTAVHLLGVKGSSILLFAGTDGLTLSGNYLTGIVEGITLLTNSATGGKAINFSNATYDASVTLRDIHIGVVDYTVDRWAFGLWATFWESSAIYNLSMYAAATVNIHLEKDCNALQFYHTSITGGIGAAGPSAVSRGIEIDSTIAGASQDLWMHGGVIQGYFHESCIYMHDSLSTMDSFHIENTYATPTDGADIFIDGGGKTIIRDFFGGTVLVVQYARGVQLLGGYHPSIEMESLTQCCLVQGCKVNTLTLTGWYNEAIGNQSVGGTIQPDRINFVYGGGELRAGPSGAYHLWIDETGHLRIESSAPTSDTDGAVIGPHGPSAHIVDADGTLADITTKFNTLLSYLEGFGFIAAA